VDLSRENGREWERISGEKSRRENAPEREARILEFPSGKTEILPGDFAKFSERISRESTGSESN
jgi:hypothetical protein